MVYGEESVSLLCVPALVQTQTKGFNTGGKGVFTKIDYVVSEAIISGPPSHGHPGWKRGYSKID